MVLAKKKTNAGLGNSVINAKSRTVQKASDRHSAKDVTKESVTQETSLDDFLAKATLAGTDFTAEKLHARLIASETGKVVEAGPKVASFTESQRKLYQRRMKIPRRPQWDQLTTAEELEGLEKQAFLVWRREIAELEEVLGLTVTPFEKNLEIWRQLWRVVERSNVVIQVLDARNPLLFRSLDLEKYVTETCEDKQNFLLLNKADLLTEHQRRCWARYFEDLGMRIAFFSATALDSDEASTSKSDSMTDENSSTTAAESASEPAVAVNSHEILSCDQLIAHLKSLIPDADPHATLAIGLTGYPNVGKSSTINKLFGRSLVSVSATPGKTKHFQTHFLEPRLLLVDCPGLVMPSVVSSREEMIIMGVLSIDQMRDYVAPVRLLCQQVPRWMLESRYGISLPKPHEDEPPDRPPTAHELLTCHAYVRGFMSAKGIPDESRAARVVLKDYISGKLLYCYPPPSVSEQEFNKGVVRESTGGVTYRMEQLDQLEQKHLLSNRKTTKDVDRMHFGAAVSSLHVNSAVKSGNNSAKDSDKPWRTAQKEKRNSKEKSRRLYKHLDA